MKSRLGNAISKGMERILGGKGKRQRKRKK